MWHAYSTCHSHGWARGDFLFAGGAGGEEMVLTAVQHKACGHNQEECEGEEPFIETLDLSCSFSYHLLVLQPRQHRSEATCADYKLALKLIKDCSYLVCRKRRP